MIVRASLLLLSPLVLVALPPAAAADPGAPVDLPAREAELRATEEAFAAAFARRDAAAFFALVDEEAVFLSESGPLRGRAAVREVWSRYLEPPEPPFSWAPERAAVAPTGDEGMTTGPVFDPDGSWVGSFVSVWRRDASGTWRIVFDVGPRCPPAAPGS